MKSIKTISVALICLALSSCAKPEYFDFDTVDYYFNELFENNVRVVERKEHRTAAEQEFLEIAERLEPNSLSSSYALKLERNGYKKSVIDKAHHEDLKKIFSEKECKQGWVASCVARFRDIFIFKKKDKVVGIAKICFECNRTHIVGTNRNTDDFGQCGDFEKLESIVNSSGANTR